MNAINQKKRGNDSPDDLCGITIGKNVWYGMVWYGMVWYGMVWFGVVWCGVEF